MSHNVELAGVSFSDLDILGKAVRELVEEGVIDAKFVDEKCTIRGWRGAAGGERRYGNAAWDKEMNHDCDAGIIFNTGKYDIGFNRKPDGTYVPFLESSFMSGLHADREAEDVSGKPIRVDHGMHALPGQTAAAGNIGKLTQRYALIMAERNARRHNIQTKRSKGTNGQIQLICTQR